jgi:hypothetical protein
MIGYKKKIDRPPVESGVEILSETFENGVFVRQESLACDKDSKKYWYSYRLLSGHWHIKYHGTERPKIRPLRTICEAKGYIEDVQRKDTLSDDDLDVLQEIVVDMTDKEDKIAQSLRFRALEMKVIEMKRRDQVVIDTYHLLSEKMSSGEILTPEERDRYECFFALLQADH